MSAENMLPVQRDDASAAFFDAAAEGRLLVHQCPQGHLFAPQISTCPRCQSTELSWSEASGRATLASYAVINRRGQSELPVAIVELDEGPWIRMQLQDVSTGDLKVGLPLQIRFAAPEGGEPLPYAVPA
ncbi:Zn-ribbon domain-containing OB-fold protein [Cumulibacter soli]|uniref:Zn-ribbon domain-containing OB-fold protein n=1 Tax=Cumulibacter soli TaxID=2546344 RepID=UPI0010684E09|nr:OB-fold domain-containing protein [Cumulibacter soli]